MVLLPTPPLRECVTTILAISLQSGIRTSLRCGWRAFRRVTFVTVDRWNSGTAGRCSGNSLQRHNVVTLGARHLVPAVVWPAEERACPWLESRRPRRGLG